MDSNRNTLVHIERWGSYLSYVRPDKSYSVNWRPSQVNLPVAELQDLGDRLTDAELGMFVRILAEYASCPLIDPSGDLRGPRRLTAERLRRRCRDATGNSPRILKRLEQKGCLSFVPDMDGTEWSRDEMSRDEWSGAVSQADRKESTPADSTLTEPPIRSAAELVSSVNDRAVTSTVPPLTEHSNGNQPDDDIPW